MHWTGFVSMLPADVATSRPVPQATWCASLQDAISGTSPLLTLSLLCCAVGGVSALTV